MKEKIKVAIIGTGNISHFHMKGYTTFSNVSVVAACDINKNRVEKFCEEYNIASAYTDYTEMLEKEKIDAVSICVWNNMHMQIAIDALNAGINVLCEKPLAINAEQAALMKETAEKNNKLLMVGFVKRFSGVTDAAKSFIDDNELGEIYFIKEKYVRRNGNPTGWFSDKKRSGGGPLIDLGVHMIDLGRYLVGKPKCVSVSAATFNGIGTRAAIKSNSSYKSEDVIHKSDVEDMCVVMMRFDNKVVLQLEVSFCANIKEDETSVELYGTKGGMKIEPTFEIYSEKSGYLTDTTPKLPNDAGGFSAMFRNETAHFIDCVENGSKCINTAEDGVVLMEIIDAIYKSANEGKEITLSGV